MYSSCIEESSKQGNNLVQVKDYLDREMDAI